MADNISNNNRFCLGILITGISLSTAGSMMSLIAISTLLFKTDISGTYSSWLQIATLLGVVITGIFGGTLIGKITEKSIGYLMPLLSAAILLWVLSAEINVSKGVLAIFLLSTLYGIEHPNNIRVLNVLVEKDKKASLFSFYQTVSQVVTMFSPLVAAAIIANLGIALCIVIDIATCMISALIWLLLPYHGKINKNSESSSHIWSGYLLLFNNKDIRNLNFSRMINNVSFTIFTVGLPVFIARLVNGDQIYFSNLQGYTLSASAIAFVLSGLVGTYLLKRYPKNIFMLTILTSSLGFMAVVFGYTSSSTQMLILSASILGVAQYCFRVSGITLGLSVTPEQHLGQVIIAGDTIVRLSSFLIALTVPDLIQLSYESASALVLFVASISLVSPILLLNVVKQYKNSLGLST